MEKSKVVEALRVMVAEVFGNPEPTSGFHQRVIERAKADIEKAIAGLEDGSVTLEELMALAIVHSFTIGAQSLESAEVLK